ncbi:MAG: MFS transporter, partial [Sphaerochaetaceae bacterium]|nr:MFS transporter [Sphaerochaetaceae bacterium]
LLIAIGAAFEIGMMIFGGRLLQKGRITTWQMIFSSTIGLALRLLIYCFTTSIWAFAIAQTLHAFTYGAIHVGVTKYIVEHVEHNHIGFAMGFYWGACTNIPEMLGAFVGGFIIDSFGYDVLFLSYSAFPIIAGVLMLVLRRQLETKR